MATTNETEDKIVEHNELSPKNFEKVMSNESDNEIDDKKPKSEDELIVEQLAPDYVQADDAMHVDFDENQWLPCIPGLSLSLATIICAVIGAGVGCAIAFADGKTITVEEIETTYMNVTAEYNPNMNYDMVDIIDIYTENGKVMVDFINSTNTTTMEEDTEPVLSDEWEKIIGFPGTLWVRALKLLVLPLIVLMMVILPSRVDEIGFIGKRAVPLYLFTSSMAAIQGTIWAWVIAPGKIASEPADVEDVELSDTDITELDAFLNIFYNAVPDNIVTAMADLTILGVICFFIGIGVLLRRPNVKQVERDVVLNFSKAILRCCMMAVVWVVWFTPIGMGSLVCVKLATTDNLANLLGALGIYLLTVIIGHSIHVFGFYPAVFWATTRGNGWLWFSKIWQAPWMALATSSSAATLPRSLQVARDAGVRQDSFQFILPLGAAINMDGTALGFPIMIALIAQLNDVELDFGTVLVIMILSVVISVGTAPIPNAGMVYLTMLFEAAGMGHLAGEGLATLFVLDWIVDRIETAVNVTSDQFVAKIIDEAAKNQEAGLKVTLGCCICGGNPEATSNGYSGANDITPENETAEV